MLLWKGILTLLCHYIIIKSVKWYKMAIVLITIISGKIHHLIKVVIMTGIAKRINKVNNQQTKFSNIWFENSSNFLLYQKQCKGSNNKICLYQAPTSTTFIPAFTNINEHNLCGILYWLFVLTTLWWDANEICNWIIHYSRFLKPVSW